VATIAYQTILLVVNNMSYDLASILGPVGASPYALDAADQEFQQGQVKNLTGLQDLMQNEQMNPLKVQQQGLANQTAEAALPGVKGQATLLKNKGEMSTLLFPQDLSQAHRDHLLAAKKSDLEMLEASAQQMMYSPDPQVREQGKALYMMKGSIVAEQAKQRAMLDRQSELEQIKQSGLDRRAQLAARTKASAVKKASALKLSFEQAYNYYTDQAANAKTPEEAQALNELAENARQNWIYARQNKPVDPNAVNVPGMADLPAAQPAAPPKPRTEPGAKPTDDPFAGFTATLKKK